MVLALNTVCDVYFAGSIDLLCEAWDLTPDVAGATCSHCDKKMGEGTHLSRNIYPLVNLPKTMENHHF